MLRVEKYGRTRHWALWDGDVLVAVMVYKKGPKRCGSGSAASQPARLPGSPRWQRRRGR